jgi:hypothetical protein
VLTPLGLKHSPRKDFCFSKISEWNPVTRLRPKPRWGAVKPEYFMMVGVTVTLPVFGQQAIAWRSRLPEHIMTGHLRGDTW